MFDIDELLDKIDKEELYTYHVQEYEKLIHHRLPACSKAFNTKIEQTFSVLDVKGFSMSKLSKRSRDVIKLAISIGQDNYPEIMFKMLIINAPLMFRGAWSVIGPFIDKKTKDKITILGSKYQKDLFEYVDPENVPEFMGGTCTYSDEEGGWHLSDKGPWQEYPGDEFYEVQAKQLQNENTEEVKIGIDQPESVDTNHTSSSHSIPVPQPAVPSESNVEVNFQIDANSLPGPDSDEEVPVHKSNVQVSLDDVANKLNQLQLGQDLNGLGKIDGGMAGIPPSSSVPCNTMLSDSDDEEIKGAEILQE